MTGWGRWRAPVWAWVSRRSIRHLLLGVGAVALLVSGVFGGLRQAPPEPLTTLAAGKPHSATPFEITITKVSWATDLGESFDPPELGRFLVVFAEIRTDQDRSVDSFVVKEALRIRGLPDFAKSDVDQDPVDSDDADPLVVVATDRVPLGGIGPGLTYEVAYIWQQDDAQPLPASVEVQAYEHGFRRSSLDGQENWFDSTPEAIGTFPVTELKAA